MLESTLTLLYLFESKWPTGETRWETRRDGRERQGIITHPQPKSNVKVGLGYGGVWVKVGLSWGSAIPLCQGFEKV